MTNFPIPNLTPLERKVLAVITREAANSYCAWLEDIVEALTLHPSVVSGALGSLARKELVLVESRDAQITDIFPILNGRVYCSYDEDEEADKYAQKIAEYAA